MVELNSIVRYLNRELKVKDIRDSSKNGLQIRGRSVVNKIGFAVDGCLEVFRKARESECDMIIVHHGILWKRDYNKEIAHKRIDFLKRNVISLYGVHLPLDIHKGFGNNIGLCRMLGLKNIKKFGRYHGIKIGYKGEFEKPLSLTQIAKILEKGLNTRCRTFAFGKRWIRRIGIISGGGSNVVVDAAAEGLDAYLSGEINLSARHIAREAKINYIAAGHYATESVGVKAMMPLLSKRFGVKTIYIENKVDL